MNAIILLMHTQRTLAKVCVATTSKLIRVETSGCANLC
jgi:hypothetical protein